VDRTCASCGAQVGALADKCGACGGDPDIRLIELGGITRRPAARPAAVGGGTTWRRWAPLIGGFVALWAVVAVTTGGFSGDGGGEAGLDPSSTSTTEVDGTGTTGRPGRAETTTTSVVLPGAPILGQPAGFSVVLVGDRSSLLDLDSGEVIRMPVSRVLAVAAGGLLVTSAEGLAYWPEPFDGSGAVLLTSASPDQVWVAGEGTEVWTLDSNADGSGIRVRLLELSGEVLLTHQFESAVGRLWPVGAIDDGLVISAPGGTYIVGDGGGIDLISTGSALAAAGQRVHVAICDGTLHCGVEVLNSDGDVLEHRDGAAPLGGPVSPAPDGRLAYVIFDETGAQEVRVDDRTVADVDRAGVDAMGWSPDGRWLLVVTHPTALFVDTFVGTPSIAVALPPLQWSWAVYSVPTG